MSMARKSSALSDAQIRERIAHKLQFHTNVAHIARTLELDYDYVLGIVRELDAEEANRLRDASDEEKGWQIRILKAIASKSLDVIEEGRELRDAKFELVLDKDGKPIKTAASAKDARTVMLALADIRKIEGLDAPTKSVNLNLSGKTLVHPADQKELLDADPVVLEHQLAINARRRAIGIPVRRDGPAALDGDGRGGLGDPDQPGG